MFLIPLMLLLYRPNTVALISGKIIIKRPLHKPFVIEKENITQISVTKNENHSLRWLLRLFFVVCLSVYYSWDNAGFAESGKVISRLCWAQSISVESFGSSNFPCEFLQNRTLTLYNQTLKVTTSSNLKLCFYTDEPEKLTGFLKNENEWKMKNKEGIILKL